MVIRGECQIDVFTFGFTIHGKRNEWTLTVTAPGFPFGTTTSEDTTTEANWYPLFNEMVAAAYENACRRRFPGREAASEAQR